MALITDAHPLIPHAQGISSFALSARFSRPSGNGIPINMAGGAIRATVIKKRTGKEKLEVRTKKSSRKQRYSILIDTTPDTAKNMVFPGPQLSFILRDS